MNDGVSIQSTVRGEVSVTNLTFKRSYFSVNITMTLIVWPLIKGFPAVLTLKNGKHIWMSVHVHLKNNIQVGTQKTDQSVNVQFCVAIKFLSDNLCSELVLTFNRYIRKCWLWYGMVCTTMYWNKSGRKRCRVIEFHMLATLPVYHLMLDPLVNILDGFAHPGRGG